MPDNNSPDNRCEELRGLWQAQPAEVVSMSIEQLQSRAGKFRSTIAWRNAREAAAAAVVVAGFGAFLFWVRNPIIRAGAGLIIFGCLYATYRLFRNGTARDLPAELGLRNSIEFHRNELQRQYDLLRGVWRWYLGPFLPGLAVFLAGDALTVPNRVAATVVVVLGGLAVGLTFFTIARINARAARGIRRRIDDLDALLAQK
jgi:hypothetical protein